MTIYCKIDGIDGGVTAKGYEKWIQLQDCGFGLSRNVMSVGGKMSDRGSGTVQLTDVQASKESDVASAKLLENAFQGKGVKVEFAYVTTGDKPLCYKKIILTDAILSSWNVGGGGMDDKPFESVSFGYAKVEVEFCEYDKKGDLKGKQMVGFDLETMLKL